MTMEEGSLRVLKILIALGQGRCGSSRRSHSQSSSAQRPDHLCCS